MNIEFLYSLKSEIKIKALSTLGLVVGYYYGENGVQYQIAYFLDGERKTTYMYPEEIKSTDGHEQAGFINSEYKKDFMQKYFGKCNRCGTILETNYMGWFACNGGGCNGEVYVFQKSEEHKHIFHHIPHAATEECECGKWQPF